MTTTLFHNFLFLIYSMLHQACYLRLLRNREGGTMKKRNCWEIKKCGREPGGAKAGTSGTCPAAVEAAGDGTNNGQNGGRICWAIAGTFCGGKVQGDFAQKNVSCMSCEVFKMIKKEEGSAFTLMMSGKAYIGTAG